MNAAGKRTLREVAEEIGSHLADIETLFVPGMKLTIVVRHPDFPDGSRNMVLTSDTLPDAAAALEIFRERSLKTQAGVH